MDPERQKPVPKDRRAQDEIIRECSHTLPTIVLARLLELRTLEILRRREKLGIHITLRQSKRTTRRFLNALPNLTLLPLSAVDCREIRVMRHEWLQRRVKKDIDLEEKRQRFAAQYCFDFPTSVLGCILRTRREVIYEYLEKEGVHLSRSVRRKIWVNFAKQTRCPDVKGLSSTGRERLWSAWKKLRDLYLAYCQRKAEKTGHYAAELLERLRTLRANYLSQPDHEQEVLHPCSGECGESWPRNSDFFTPNFRSADKLGNRCSYCRFVRTQKQKRQEGARKNRPKGRILKGRELEHVRKVIAEYGNLIPCRLLEELFQVGAGTIVRLRHDCGIKQTMSQANEILWRWCFRHDLPDLPQLEEFEIVELQVLTRKLKEKQFRPFERNSGLLRTLRERKRLIETDAQRAGKSVDLVCCRRCQEAFPPESEFFRTRAGKIERLCKVCASYRVNQSRLKNLKKRFGNS